MMIFFFRTGKDESVVNSASDTDCKYYFFELDTKCLMEHFFSISALSQTNESGEDFCNCYLLPFLKDCFVKQKTFIRFRVCEF